MSLCFSSVYREHMAVLCFFCVLCSPVYCLTPLLLLSDYWLICPTCPVRYPSLFVPLFSLPVFVVQCWFVVYGPLCVLYYLSSLLPVI